MASSRNAMRRLMRELEAWQEDQREAAAAGEDADNNPNRGIERLGLAADAGADADADATNLLHWEAVLNGAGVGGGYDHGRWLLDIVVPPTYPLQPPAIRFVTPVLHANVHAQTGAICLDLLDGGRSNSSSSGSADTNATKGPGAWTPALSVAACVRAVRMLLGAPGLDSPLNVDLAVLQRTGDTVAATRLIELWCEEHRYEGA